MEGDGKGKLKSVEKECIFHRMVPLDSLVHEVYHRQGSESETRSIQHFAVVMYADMITTAT